MNQKTEQCHQNQGWFVSNMIEVTDFMTGDHYSFQEVEQGGCADKDEAGNEYGYAYTPDSAFFDSQTEGMNSSYQVVCSILCVSWSCEDDAENGEGYDGTYSGTGQTVSPLGTATSSGTFTVTNGYVTDPDGLFTGNVDSSGYFTGKWYYSEGSLPIPMSGMFSPSSSFTLSGSIGETVSGTFTLHKP
ncbi:hypothetical protein EXS74_01035 [Candidatus Woesearchaeota archaeon]|nr:hypothetical protein [Candidatus Woesearchaeota archaeon]